MSDSDSIHLYDYDLPPDLIQDPGIDTELHVAFLLPSQPVGLTHRQHHQAPLMGRVGIGVNADDSVVRFLVQGPHCDGDGSARQSRIEESPTEKEMVRGRTVVVNI